MRSIVSIVFIVAATLSSSCSSREEKMRALEQKRNLLLLELRELPGYSAAKEKISADVRKPLSAMDRLTRQMNSDGADYYAEKDARDERDLANAVDGQFRKVCLALGALRLDGSKDSAIDAPGAIKTFFDSAATENKCREAWATEQELRDLVKNP